MTSAKAWKRGWEALWRHPWLALLPLGWGVAQIGLAWLGIPVGLVSDLGQLSDRQFLALVSPHGEGMFIRAFIPSWLPDVTDLPVPIAPEVSLGAVGKGPFLLLTGLLIVPLVEALVTAAFLVWLSQVITDGAPRFGESRARIARALPGLYILGLGWHVAYMLLPVDGLLALGLFWFSLFPLLALVIGAGDRALLPALLEAPGALWGRLGRWLGIGWRTALVTIAFTLGWMMAGGSMLVALAVYPVLATGLVGAAVALCFGQEDAPEVRPVWWTWAAVLPAAAALALGGATLSDQWEGYRVTRESAIEPNPIWIESPPRIAKVQADGDRELVVYRGAGFGIAELQRSRFGWKRLWHYEFRAQELARGGRLASFEWIPHPMPYYEHLLLVGELHDSRVAYLEVAGERYGIPPEDPIFLITFPYPQDYTHLVHGLRYLDVLGQPLDSGEGVRP